jgi:preprotein translocase subunit SecB
MKLQLLSWNVKSLNLIEKDSPIRDRKKFELVRDAVFFEDQKDKFIIKFDINLDDEYFDMSVAVDYLFECDGEFPESFKDSDFIKVNAPAIAFPYLRAFISNVTLQCGLSPIILPSINFIALNENEAKNKGKSKKRSE